MNDALRRHSPAAERNRDPILRELVRLLPARGLALEIASGSGQHAAHFGRGLPLWTWQPTDGDGASALSIDAWCAGLANVRPALRLDVLDRSWAGVPARLDAIFCANLLHIAPWLTCAALMHGAARHLAAQGLLLVYGPFLVVGQATAPGNLAFDADLRQRDPQWGLRRLADVVQEAEGTGLRLRESISMPANNLMLAFGR